MRPRCMLYSAALIALAGACQAAPALREVDIHATEFAFRVPATLPAGLTAFRFINDGTVSHEVQLYRLRNGIAPELAAKMVGRDSVPDTDSDAWGSVLIAGPGKTATERVLISLVSGEQYALICEFRNADSLPHHSKLGMVALVRVE